MATPRSLVLDLLSIRRPEPISVSALVVAGQVFGFESAAIRMALSRLARQGYVESPARGRYRLTERATPLAAHVSAWRTLEARVRPWKGGWLAVATGGLGRTRRASVRTRDRALSLWGFARLRPGLHVRPDNLVSPLPHVRSRLVELGLEPTAPVFALGDLGPQQAEASALWSPHALDAAYRTQRDTLVEVHATWVHDPVSPHAARATFEAGGAVLRMLAFDPLLPEPIVDTEARRALILEMERFDAFGRAAWFHLLALEPAA